MWNEMFQLGQRNEDKLSIIWLTQGTSGRRKKTLYSFCLWHGRFTNELVWEESSFGLNVYSLLSGVNGEMLTNEEVSDLKLYSREHLVAIDPKFERHHLYDQWMSHTIEYPQQEARDYEQRTMVRFYRSIKNLKDSITDVGNMNGKSG
ncbi:uncharacterized protein LOC121981716 isoform X3 [Zingiber officinale]|uniref:uncharacterized protein LOC121981716 isoform X3 n=1 Tax=Zingiber officinale TaxID=94328 RepID=UPI001C4AC440|nr:uncharacterized protein LOC121981716 isoform X3 [Zingiber officinale]